MIGNQIRNATGAAHFAVSAAVPGYFPFGRLGKSFGLAALGLFLTLGMTPAVALPFASHGTESSGGGGSPFASDFDSGPGSTSVSVASSGAALFQGMAATAFGVNRALVKSQSVIIGESVGGVATSLWQDLFTITGSSLGTVGTAAFGVMIGGSLVNVGESSTSYSYSLEYDPNDDTFTGNQTVIQEGQAGPGEFNNLFVGTFDFIYDVAFAVVAELGVSAAAGDNFGTGLGFADFSTSAVLTMIELPAGAILSAASGTTYPIPTTGGQEVPEPATLALVVFGLAGLGMMRRRRK